MNRPLETTFWMRFTQFMKGVFLYNTIYWRRASDDLNIRHMSHEERANLRPKRDLEIIRPRARARAHEPKTTASLRGGEYSEPRAPEPAAPVSTPSVQRIQKAVEDDDTVVEIHRRRKRRSSRHSKVMPRQYYETSGPGGLLKWLFKK